MWQYCLYLLILIFITSCAAVQNLLESVRQDATQKWYGPEDRITTIDVTTAAKIHRLAMSIPIPRL